MNRLMKESGSPALPVDFSRRQSSVLPVRGVAQMM
jgi:hypothetical protein